MTLKVTPKSFGSAITFPQSLSLVVVVGFKSHPPHTHQRMIIIVIMIIALVVLEFVVPFAQKKTKPEQTSTDSDAQTLENGVPET